MAILSNMLLNIRTKLIKPYVKGDVLDLGCGPAYNLEISKERIHSYCGVECSAPDVEKLSRKYPQHKFFQKNLDDDELEFDQKFDTILLIAVIEHIYNQKHLFQQMVKNLKPGGRIIITTPTPFGNDIVHRIGAGIGLFNKFDRDDHIVVYNKKRFEIAAQDFGLKIQKYKKFELGCNQMVVMSL